MCCSQWMQVEMCTFKDGKLGTESFSKFNTLNLLFREMCFFRLTRWWQGTSWDLHATLRWFDKRGRKRQEWCRSQISFYLQWVCVKGKRLQDSSISEEMIIIAEGELIKGSYGERLAYIARWPTHSGRLWRASSPFVHCYFTAQTKGIAVTLHDWKKKATVNKEKVVFSISV